MTDDGCEICQGEAQDGLGLCHSHLLAWFRSPERLRLHVVEPGLWYDMALEAFVKRMTQKDMGAAA